MKREASLISSDSHPSQAAPPALLVEVRRGSITESRHYGHLAVVDGDGQLLSSRGAHDVVTYLRSSAKPHQAVPLLASGAADHFRFTDKEIALACGSHNSEAEHTEVAVSMLEKIGLDERALHCGSHEPYSEETARELKRRGEKPGPLHNNCSGKHAMMLALSRYLKAPVKDYESLEHPVQQLIAETIAEFSDVPVSEMGIGVDGCAAPNFAIPLRAMAVMYARLVRPPVWLSDAKRAACARVVRAMLAYPEMVEGRGELDTELMKACGGQLISKVGAEGLYTAGALPSARFPKGLGIAFKIEDGDKNDRARSPLAVELLRQLGLADAVAASALAKFVRPVIRNHRGDEVGEAVAVLDLEGT